MSPLSSRLASLLVLLSLPSLALSCTTVAVPTETDGLVIGRTMELGGLDLLPHWKMVVHPRSSAGTPGGSNPLGFVSVDVLTNDRIPPAVALGTCAEGMNENGLSVSAQTQQGAEYQDFLFDDAAGALKPRLPYLDVAAYILGTCSSAADVEEALRSVVVYGKSAPKGARFHWVIFDADDQSLIVEYIAGELVVRDNTAVGVFTNDPVYDWHVTNLNNYVSLAPVWPELPSDVSVETDVPSVPRAPVTVGHGHNLLSLPGSTTSPARFVTMFYLRQHALSALGVPASASAGVSLVTGLLNKVFIVRGTVPSPSSRSDAKYDNSLELTQWATIKMPAQRTLMFRSYDNSQWRRVNVGELDFSGDREYDPLPLSISNDDGILDIEL